VAPTPRPPVNGLVLGDERGVFWIDPVSGEMLPLLAEPLGAAWALRDQHLALVRGRQVEIVDLASGEVAMLATGITAELAEAQVLWGADTQTLLLVGWVEPDPLSDEPRQEVIFQELHPNSPSAAAVVKAVVHDGSPAMLLGYDAPGQRALLWRPSDDGRQLDVLALNLATGQTEAMARLDALSELALGPGGALAALAEGASGYQLVLTGLSDQATHTLPLELGAYATQLAWSPDGAQLAFLLRRGELYDPESEAAGLYVYDLVTDKTSGPLTLPQPHTTIIGWAPDGQGVLVHNQSGDTQYYALVELSGGGERPLPLNGAAACLGWLPRPDVAPDAPALDAWRGRFAAAVGDAEATGAAAASFMAGNPDLSLSERSAQLSGYYAAAGWPQRAWRAIALSNDLVVLEAPPSSILLATGGAAQVIGQGQALADARLAQSLLAVIYGGDYGSARQWSVSLLQEQQGRWQTVWQPLGRIDWVTTDGAVKFAGEGIETLQVTGNSRGLPAEAFVECESCPLRQLAATWRLEGAAYVRKTGLPTDAPAAAAHWEMTAPTPYALLYEAIRRLRAGEAIGALATPTAAAQLAQLELQDRDLRLMVAEVTADSVVFGPAAMPDRYRAVIRQSRIDSVGPRP
jgi:hypothetical protein